ncbi:MAG: hypothetical protein R3F59_22195 [Myxococcota bacterium]
MTLDQLMGSFVVLVMAQGLAGLLVAVSDRPPASELDRLGRDPLRPWVYFVAPNAAFLAWVGWKTVGPLLGAPLALLALAAAEPWWLARAVAIPRGWVRAAWVLTRISPWAWGEDRAGGALFAAGWAAARRPQRDEAAERWVVEGEPDEVVVRLGEERLTGSAVAGYGLLAASAGDREHARALLDASVRWFAPPGRVARVAWRWLAADAAGRGDWAAAHEAGTAAGTADGALVAGIAARLLRRADAPDRAALEALHRGFPRDSDAYGFARASTLPDWPPAPEEPLAAALTWHRRARVRPVGVGMAALAWDGAPADPALRADVVADLAEIVRTSACDPRGLAVSFVGREVLAALRPARRLALRTAVDTLLARSPNDDRLPVHELAWWLEIRRRYDATVAVSVEVDDRRDAYAAVYPAVLRHAEALYRRRHQGPAFRATLRWLRAEAAALKRKDALRALDAWLGRPAPGGA